MNDASPLPYCTCKHCTCNLTQKVHQREQDHRLIQFMMKLSEKFSVVVRGNVLMQSPLPNLSTVFRMFSQEEKHQAISQSHHNQESLAFLAETKKPFDYKAVGHNAQRQSSGNTNFYAHKTAVGLKKVYEWTQS